jgi:hypothetical protein
MLYYDQILVAICVSHVVYAPAYAKPWIDPYPYSVGEIESRFGKARKQEIFIAGF